MQLPVQLLKRKVDTHKGNYGHVLIIGGATGFTGAVCLCAKAAMRSGAGLVTVAVPSSLNSIVEIKLTEEMSFSLFDKGKGYILKSTGDQIRKISEKADVLAIGCGALTHPSTIKFFLKLIKTENKPLVIDADGLNALSRNINVLAKRKSKKIVLTPHPGEFLRLVKVSKETFGEQRKELAKNFALRYNLVLVLKGHRSIVTDGEAFFENETGNPGMATAGSGDVLTGIIASFIAQGLSSFDAAKFAVYVHGLAGDLAAEEKTEICLVASDLIEFLPKVFIGLPT